MLKASLFFSRVCSSTYIRLLQDITDGNIIVILKLAWVKCGVRRRFAPLQTPHVIVSWWTGFRDYKKVEWSSAPQILTLLWYFRTAFEIFSMGSGASLTKPPPNQLGFRLRKPSNNHPQGHLFWIICRYGYAGFHVGFFWGEARQDLEEQHKKPKSSSWEIP